MKKNQIWSNFFDEIVENQLQVAFSGISAFQSILAIFSCFNCCCYFLTDRIMYTEY